MPLYKVVALQDISQPTVSKPTTPSGRVLDITEEETETQEGKRCLKLILSAPDGSLVTAFELQQLPYTADQLLSAQLQVDGAEIRHGVLLLTPRCAHIGSIVRAVSELDLGDFMLDDDDFAQIGAHNVTVID
ncbi:hypothetical protein PSACC_02209 [Paramicrosporidium saccamoebae]|uniref:RecQ mediated genome instability protein 1 OB-fold domain-containing protein n=1 Tax=Paramicrosporidium saccamoebae TaxID=1246581 RepID=A0A2H9TJK2_9FUNG|nr:hypothetical protein PSACC_02209 [Paramicrosporidium saccamoebae]